MIIVKLSLVALAFCAFVEVVESLELSPRESEPNVDTTGDELSFLTDVLEPGLGQTDWIGGFKSMLTLIEAMTELATDAGKHDSDSDSDVEETESPDFRSLVHQMIAGFRTVMSDTEKAFLKIDSDMSYFSIGIVRVDAEILGGKSNNDHPFIDLTLEDLQKRVKMSGALIKTIEDSFFKLVIICERIFHIAKVHSSSSDTLDSSSSSAGMPSLTKTKTAMISWLKVVHEVETEVNIAFTHSLQYFVAHVEEQMRSPAGFIKKHIEVISKHALESVCAVQAIADIYTQLYNVCFRELISQAEMLMIKRQSKFPEENVEKIDACRKHIFKIVMEKRDIYNEQLLTYNEVIDS